MSQGSMHRFGDPPRSGQRYTLRPGAYGLILRGSDALLTEQSDQWSTEIQLPGGGIDPGESPIQALHRECLEETGWRVDVRYRLGVYRWFVFMPEYDLHAEKICHIYLCRPAFQISEPIETHHRTVWMPVEETSKHLISHGDRAFVDAFCANQAVAKH